MAGRELRNLERPFGADQAAEYACLVYRNSPDCTIRIVLDNHSAHLSNETRTFLATRPNRFQYVLTPKHGSWLNIVETLFGKMARTFLRHIRVQSWEELRDRILLGIAEISAFGWEAMGYNVLYIVSVHFECLNYSAGRVQSAVSGRCCKPDGSLFFAGGAHS